MNSTLEFIKESWKAILGFLAVFVGQVVQRAFTEQAVMPSTVKGWGLVIGLSFIGAVVIYITPNKRNSKQVANDLEKLPEDDQKGVILPVVERNPAWTSG